MIKFIISIYRNTDKKARVRIVLFNLIYSALSIGWLVQLHLLVKKFDINTTETRISIVLVSITFLISVFFYYFQTKKSINDVSKSMLVSSLELWNQFSNLNYAVFKSKQRVIFFDIFMVNFWRIRSGYQSFIVNTIPILFTSILLFLFLFYIHPIIALVFICFYTLLIFFQLGLQRQFSNSTKDFHNVWREQSNNVGRWIDQHELRKQGRGREESLNEFKKGFEYFLQKGDEVNTKKEKWSSIQGVLLQISRIGTLVIGYFLYKKGIIDLPSIFSAVIVLGWLQGQLSKLQSAVPILIDASNSFRFNKEFLEWNSSENLKCIKDEFEESIPIKEIELKNISFQYESGKMILDNLSVKLKTGKVYLIKGTNGSGKTTLAKIILGLLFKSKGELKINSKPIKKEFSDELKYRMSYLHQDFSLFYGTLKENYTFGLKEPSINLTEMSRVLLSEIKDENRHIGEKGEKLSGGQKQRLSLIREWGKNSDLYILDEPLNHLDKDSSEWLKSSILEKKKSSIIIIISHQSGFENLADEVKYLKNGKLYNGIPPTS